MLKKNLLMPVTIIIFVCFIQVAYLFKGIQNDCFHATDFSIYQQAIFDMSLSNLNPFLTVRNINVLNDHFDPIIFSAGAFVTIFGENPFNLIIFELLWFFAAILLVVDRNQSLKTNTKIILLILFTKGIWSALHFPIHPSTWSIFPIILLFKNIYKERGNIIILLSCLFLFLFKEIFCFATLFLGISFMFQKRMKLALYIITLSIAWAFFIFKLMPILLGENYPHGGLLLDTFLASPIKMIMDIEFKAALKLFIPFTLPLYILMKRNIINNVAFNAIFFLAPIAGLHVLANKVGFHYGSFLVAPLLAACIFNKDFIEQIIKEKKIYSLTLALFILTGIGRHTKAFNLVFLNKSKKCDLSDGAKLSRNKLRSIISTLDLKKRSIIASGSLIPYNYLEHQKYYQLALFNDKAITSYDYVLLTRGNTSNTYPLSMNEIEKVASECIFETIILDDKYHFMAAGLRDTSCLPSSKQN